MHEKIAISGIIQELILDATRYNAKDALVNINWKKAINVSSSYIFGVDNLILENSRELKALIKQDELFIREIGNATLCLGIGKVIILRNELEIEAPLLLVPVSHKFSKINNNFQIEFLYEDFFRNPFLEKEYPELELENVNLENILDFLLNTSVHKFETIFVLDNFHYHRKAVLHDLSQIEKTSLSKNLSQLLDHALAPIFESVAPLENLYNPLSPEQESVLNNAMNNNIAIQGPPGTGKSQLISELVLQNLSLGRNVAVVSEKRAALSVIYDKMKAVNLDQFCFIFQANQNNKYFIESLRKTWKFIEESTFAKDKINTNLKQQIENLQLNLSLYNKPGLIGGLSYRDFMERFSSAAEHNATYESNIPELIEVLKNENALKLIYVNDLNSVLRFLPKVSLSSNNLKKISDSFINLKQIFIEVEKILNICGNSGFIQDNFLNLKNIEVLKRLAIWARIKINAKHRNYDHLLQEKNRKSFLKLFKEFKNLEAEKSKIDLLENKWNEIPSKADLDLLIGLNSKSWWQNRKLKKYFEEKLKNSLFDLNIIQSELTEIHTYREDKQKLDKKFAILGVENETANIYELHVVLTTSNIFSDEKLDNSLAELLNENIKEIDLLNDFFKTYFTCTEEQDLKDLSTVFQSKVTSLLKNKNLLSDLDSLQPSKFFSKNSYEELLQSSVQNAWIDFKGTFPQLAAKTPSQLLPQINELLLEQKTVGETLIHEILNQQIQKFQDAHKIIQQENRKLSLEQKELRKTLKNGKRILIKEFGKKTRHQSIRNLYQSDARLWIEILIPITLANPEQICESFPLQNNLFEQLIFDEASQIPLYKAVPVIQRAKKYSLAGDSQQMGIQQYFESGSADLQDLLHQASYTLPQFSLNEHYRSAHPALIAFSNKYFYGDKLLPFPSADAEKQPIVFTKIENGIYENRANIIEAKAVAKIFTELLQNDVNVGLVAFSETQLSAILNEIEPNFLEILEKKLDDNSAFAKALENVQGDECDVLLISFGYGKNQEGKFLMKFGPLNMESGAKRLNVLFSRARKQIHFVASVDYKDFNISKNESVELLRHFFRSLPDTQIFDKNENFPTDQEVKLPFTNIEYSIEGKTIHLPAAPFNFANAHQLLHVVRVLRSKNWIIDFS